MKDKILLILTYCYPSNPPREVFLHHEIPFLANRFSKIILIPTARQTMPSQKYEIECKNVVTLQYKRCLRFVEVIFGFFVRGLFYPPFWRDFFQVLFKEKDKKEKIKNVFQHYLKNGYLLLAINKALAAEKILTRDNSYLIYSYWLNGNALLGAMIASRLNKQGFNVRAISRAHGLGDLYVPYRPGTAIINNNIDVLFPISRIGLRHLVANGVKTRIMEVARLGVRRCDYKQTIQGESNHIYSCAMLTKNKRIDVIVEALSKISDIKIEWTHFGEGEEMANLIKQCQSSLGNNIKWQLLGNVENEKILKYLIENKPRCLINSSIIEGIPVSIMEAFSCSVPAIAPDVGAISEIVINNKNGVLLPSDFSSENMANAIKSILKTSDMEILEMRKNALRTWDDLYNSEKNYALFADKCSSLL